MAPTMEELESIFDDHPSLSASLQGFEPGGSEIHVHNPNHNHAQSPRRFGYTSHHSGFRSEDSSEMGDSVSGGRFSPPAWKRDGNGSRSSGFWDRDGSKLGQRSRESSMEFESADEGEGEGEDPTLAAALRTRLPTGSLSPEKRRSPSPDPWSKGDREYRNTFGGQIKQEPDVVVPSIESPNNYIRLAVRAEVQHRTEPFKAPFEFVKGRFDTITRSWTSLFCSAAIACLSILAMRALFQPGNPPPVPDLVKVAGLAKQFEPLIFYSEKGMQQIGDLQSTGVAVWDLGESVRSTNMAQAAVIAEELDGLSDNMNMLAIELIRFFANVDGDVDRIVIVIDWARRELLQLQILAPSALTFAFDNIHTFFTHCGLLESGDIITGLGKFTTSVFGLTLSQRTRRTLQRTFTEFVAILEESVDSELHNSLALLAIFESMDKQFLALAHVVVFESTAQDSAQDDMLSSLWTKILGPNPVALRKFEKNQKLLLNIRAKTVQNKIALLDHNSKLLSLKANLEMLRRQLVSPLVRANGSTIGLDDQIRGLEEVSGILGTARRRQKANLMEMLTGRRYLGVDGGGFNG
ncbi:hypothetical protein BJ875DRAFT_452872 [Amylocarpus encephaloides]|uniref:Uncharacterized protein n=1 Tax=Amylocarpus encephaloides TaxID=45428 RepID=A0A9P7YQJ0_9HELO|nr:hypothetical protein BJ875DRAFT_452872 [Amylocarpus encephaloides]